MLFLPGLMHLQKFPKFNEPDIHKITVHELGIGLLRIRLLGLCNGDESLALVNPFTDQLLTPRLISH